MMNSLICGVGFNDRKYPASIGGKDTKEYILWNNLLKRCYCSKTQEERPTYKGCSVSEKFKSYSDFYEWCLTQIGFGQESFHLDKDLIFKGNKLYSEDTCLFLPRELNVLLTTRKSLRGSLPIGVSAHQGRFLATCNTNKLSRHIGLFNTAEEAFQAYKQVKEAFIKRQAEKWKTFIDPRAYEALIAYTVSITD